MLNNLLKKIKNRKARVGIIGLGYVGLPLAVEYAEEGFSVIGLDISKQKVAMVNSARSYIDDIPNDRLTGLVKSGKLTATFDPALIKRMDTVSICVPTPLSKTKDPDISYILSAVEWIKRYLHKEMLIILESTT
ncbi:MAG TPA: UDP-N-acetyl-D-glucosamine dehydrogenase, partial [candidate division Zixibacteria bacterium]|nr:UDP-N-acetyl-D-glucosamine dehydrogenase [candidate division Zixibacteria bacterium]